MTAGRGDPKRKYVDVRFENVIESRSKWTSDEMALTATRDRIYHEELNRGEPKKLHLGEVKNVPQNGAENVFGEKAKDAIPNEAKIVVPDGTKDRVQERARNVFRDEAKDMVQEGARNVFRDEVKDMVQEGGRNVFRDEVKDMVEERARNVFRDEAKDMVQEGSRNVFRDEAKDTVQERARNVFHDEEKRAVLKGRSESPNLFGSWDERPPSRNHLEPPSWERRQQSWKSPCKRPLVRDSASPYKKPETRKGEDRVQEEASWKKTSGDAEKNGRDVSCDGSAGDMISGEGNGAEGSEGSTREEPEKMVRVEAIENGTNGTLHDEGAKVVSHVDEPKDAILLEKANDAFRDGRKEVVQEGAKELFDAGAQNREGRKELLDAGVRYVFSVGAQEREGAHEGEKELSDVRAREGEVFRSEKKEPTSEVFDEGRRPLETQDEGTSGSEYVTPQEVAQDERQLSDSLPEKDLVATFDPAHLELLEGMSAGSSSGHYQTAPCSSRGSTPKAGAPSPFDLERHMKALEAIKASPGFTFSTRKMYEEEKAAGASPPRQKEEDFMSFAFDDYLADSPAGGSPVKGVEKSLFGGGGSPQVKSPLFPMFGQKEEKEESGGFFFSFAEEQTQEETSGFKFAF